MIDYKIVLYLILAGLFIKIMWDLITVIKGEKCKYWKKCSYYRKNSETCNKDGGMYYNWDKPAGCYIEMEKKEKK